MCLQFATVYKARDVVRDRIVAVKKVGYPMCSVYTYTLQIPVKHNVTTHHYLSRDIRKPTMWFPNRSDKNQAVQAQKMARSLKFWT